MAVFGKTPRLVLVARLLMLVLAAAATLSSVALSLGDARIASTSRNAYACPMHPAVTSQRPGTCTVCRMALETVRAAVLQTPASVASSLRQTDSSGLGRTAWSLTPTGWAHHTRASATRRVLAREVRAPAWIGEDGLVVATLYDDQLAGLTPGEPAVFVESVAGPSVGIPVRLTRSPPSRWDRSTSHVRFRADRGAAAPASGTVGWVQFEAKPRALLLIPTSAILNSAEGPYVIAVSTDGRAFARRFLEIGSAFSGFTVVLSGLQDQERVAAGATFFLDAQLRRIAAR